MVPSMDHLSLLVDGVDGLDAAQEHDVEAWERIAAAVLRRSGRLTDEDPDSKVWDRLTRKTLDGVEVPPLGTPRTAAHVPEGGVPGRAPFTRGTRPTTPTTGWDVRPVFADPDVAGTSEAVVTDLENGATSLWLTLGPGGIDVDDLPSVLAGTFLDLAPVVLECPTDPVGAADALAAVLAGRELTPAEGTNLGADPIGARVRGLTDASADDIAATVAAVAERALTLRTRALVVDGTAVHDAGASDAMELGYTMAAGAAYLRLLVAAGHDVDTACSLLEFRYAVTDEQFPAIAKLRAARRLWHRVTELSGVSEGGRGQLQHAVTSRPMMSKYDPWVNLLRTTVAAFAAGVGGAAAVTVLPFDAALGLPDAFSRRIARNTSSLLISESHVARVTDAAGGSHAVEGLTDGLAHAGWAELGRIEESGGALAGLDSLRERVAEVADRRRAEISARKRPLTGVSEFPHLGEELPERAPYPEGAVQVARYGAEFEALRDDPAQAQVFLATLGTVASHTARATFATNLLAAGGVAVAVAGATEGVDDVLGAYGGQPVVCLAGHDRSYAEWGAALVPALRDAGARWVILAGRPAEGIEVDDTCAAGVDALPFLARVRSRLEGPG